MSSASAGASANGGASILKKGLFIGMLVAVISSTLIAPALALEYTFNGAASGETFYQSTSTDTNYIANNGQITVGTDGTVASGLTGNPSSGPLSSLDLPVGEYPESYGMATDIDIAANSVFPNELGPTTQNGNAYVPTFIPTVDSGALPTGNMYNGLNSMYSTANPMVVNPSVMPTSVLGAYAAPYGAAATYGNGVYPGLATNKVAMPTITTGGAIAHLSIPSIGINSYVYEGTDANTLAKGIGHFDCTSGWNGNIALGAHNRSGIFGKLDQLQAGDLINYKTSYGSLTYQVSSVSQVSTNDTTGLQQDGTSRLTLYTCVPNQPDLKVCVVANLVG